MHRSHLRHSRRLGQPDIPFVYGYYATPGIEYDLSIGRGDLLYYAFGGAVSEVEVNGLTVNTAFVS